VGADEQAGSVVFSVLAKLRRFALIVDAQIDIYVATLPSILILNNVGISEFSVSLLECLVQQFPSSFRILEVQNRFTSFCKLVQNRFLIFPNGAESIFLSL